MIDSPVLVLNAGSSSLKYQVVVPETAAVQAKGTIERIGEAGGRLPIMVRPCRRWPQSYPKPVLILTRSGSGRSGTGSCTAGRTSPIR